ncbi:hypothetical protein F2Q70_00029218 [Brassica cretica]|uniref:Uncharacterized protein n=1 Tax=Brassica cretica TaxID=69181 RepID=A0A8S9FKY9_BRACR|nr:hypothetical protein F2Q70_00029218 [Brassica cretica]
MYQNRPQTSSNMATGPRTSQARSLRSDRAQAEARLLRSERARTWLGCYVATKHVRGWSLRSDRTLPERRYDTNPCILVYSLMLSPVSQG